MAIADSAIAEFPIAAPSGAPSTFDESVAETMALAESVGAEGSVFGVAVSEALALVDSVGSISTFNESVIEALALNDIDSATGVFGAGVTETLALGDSVTVTSHFSFVWRLSFENVVPPPALQGPGNPGKLKGILVYKQVYP